MNDIDAHARPLIDSTVTLATPSEGRAVQRFIEAASSIWTHLLAVEATGSVIFHFGDKLGTKSPPNYSRPSCSAPSTLALRVTTVCSHRAWQANDL